MKKTGLLHSGVSYVISKMGHTDMLVIGDSGLPIPQEVQRIDLALKKGVPTFLDTLDTVLEELQVEEVVIASEMEKVSPQLYEEVVKRFAGIQITKVEHENFKQMNKKAVAMIRTGECTPYANIILKSGVVF